MIKQVYMCECDICGAIEKAKLISSNNNDEDYGLPYNWCHGKNPNICICPECNKKLNAKPAESTIIPPMTVTPVYGCPAAHVEGYTTTIGTGVTVDPIVISVDTPNTASQVVLDNATSESSVLDCARRLKAWCAKQSKCENCVLHNQTDQDECALSTREVFDWDEDLGVIDRLTWADYPVESKAANELITYCKYKTCKSCMFYNNERNQCRLTCFDVKDWDLSNVKPDAILESDTINKYLKGLKVYCGNQDSCETCPIAYFEEKPEYYHCSLTDTPVFEWEAIADRLQDEHKILAENINAITDWCNDVHDCDNCRYCRSYERCDLRLHNPADWVIYDDNIK